MRRSPGCETGVLLARIHDPSINVVHLERSLDESLRIEFERGARDRPFREELIVDTRRDDLQRFADVHLAPCSDRARRFFVEDALRWLRAFAWICDEPVLKLTLASVWSDSCRKFHADFVALRMLCTYVGPGTEYVRDEFVDREPDVDPTDIDACNEAMIKDHGNIVRCVSGDLLLLKGECWPGNRGFGAIHRSPPISAKGLRRLVITIDVLNPMLGEHAH
jgi:hypothetical protein